MTALLAAWRACAGALEPLAPVLLRARARAGKEDAARIEERLGRASTPRPQGRLVWLHGASVGESQSLIPLIRALTARRPDLNALLTSGTVAAAALASRRPLPGLIHQFAPVDGPAAAARFIGHWRPDLAVFAESDVWPNLLGAARAAGARTALVSARLSESSARGWRRARGSAARLFGDFDLILPQDEEAARRMLDVGGRDDGRLNLKFAGTPLEADPQALEEARAALAGRPLLLAASTHPGEEALLVEAFAPLAVRPEAPVLGLAPRHPARGESVADLARAAGLGTARRGAGERPTAATTVWVLDTLGELGLWFRMTGMALLGGSLLPGIGGHNPLEPARLGCAPASGPHVDNWRAVFAALDAAGGVVSAATPGEVGALWAAQLERPDAFAATAERALVLARSAESGVESAADRLLEFVPWP